MRRLLAAAGVLSALACLVLPGIVAADVNNFTISSFQADESLSRRDPQGELRIRERIAVNFNERNHGILRALPDRYRKHAMQLHINSVTSPSGAPAQYTTYSSNRNTVIKIGDADKTVTGRQEYVIDYTLRNVISFEADHDELYWNVNGTQWSQSFEQVAVTLHLPEGLRQTRAPVCYTGYQGSSAQDCVIGGEGRTITVTTTGPLSPRQTLTFAVAFEKGYFHPSRWYETAGEYAVQTAEVFIPAALIGGGTVVYWWYRGRDPKGRGVIVPEYSAPADIRPAEAGVIMDFTLDNRDITATIIDLAVRGYIKIIETKQVRKLRSDKLNYSLELVNPDTSKLTPTEAWLLQALFLQLQKGNTFDVTEAKHTLYTTANTYRQDLHESLTARGYFRGNPLHAGRNITLLTICVIGAIYIFGKTMNIWVIAGLVVGALIARMVALQLPARTAKGVAAKEYILGLKQYLEVAEKDRLQKLQSPDAAYAERHTEPVRTVDLFETLLPYAVVLGVEKQWSEQFRNIYTMPPGWYSGGSWTTFNSYYLVTSLNDGIGSAVNTAFTAPSSSGGSGFSGGSAGGGGGGGGGGGW